MGSDAVQGFLPWHETQKHALAQQIQAGRLPHALLLAGPASLGKMRFALAFAARLLCHEAARPDACGECSACLLLKAGTHPDLKMVQPGDSRLIRIDQIRELVDWAVQTASQGHARVAVVSPAEQMNHNAANCLLKYLEEPGADNYLFLVTDQPGRLLPTIRSRCQLIRFHTPPRELALSWLMAQKREGQESLASDEDSVAPDLVAPDRIALLLDLAGGAPLRLVSSLDEGYLERRSAVIGALDDLLENRLPGPGMAAGLIDPDNPVEVYDILYSLFADALKYAVSGDTKFIINNDIQDIIKVIYSKFGRARLPDAIGRIGESRQIVTGNTNPNARLLLEALLVSLREMMEPPSAKGG